MFSQFTYMNSKIVPLDDLRDSLPALATETLLPEATGEDNLTIPILAKDSGRDREPILQRTSKCMFY